MSWGTKISAVIAAMKTELAAAGYTVVTNKQIVDESRQNVLAVSVESADFDGVEEVAEGRATVNVLYKHDNDTDEDTYTALGGIEDVFESYQADGVVGLRVASLTNYYRARTQDQSVGIVSFEVIL